MYAHEQPPLQMKESLPVARNTASRFRQGPRAHPHHTSFHPLLPWAMAASLTAATAVLSSAGRLCFWGQVPNIYQMFVRARVVDKQQKQDIILTTQAHG